MLHFIMVHKTVIPWACLGLNIAIIYATYRVYRYCMGKLG